MVTKQNKHGLSRDIPNPISLEVRRRCGFGCVHCGSLIYHYEHFNPEFNDAKIHNPKGITLLCTEQHELKKKRRLSGSEIVEWNSDPWCKRNGYSWDKNFRPTPDSMPGFFIGPVGFRDTPIILSILGQPVIQFLPPEEQGGPFRLNAELRNSNGKVIARVEENQWIGPVENWDIEAVGPSFKIRNRPYDIALVWQFVDRDTIAISKLKMGFEGTIVDVTKGPLKMTSPRGGQLVFHSAVVGNAKKGVDITRNGFRVAPGGTISIGRATIEHNPGPPALVFKGIQFNNSVSFWSRVDGQRCNVELEFVTIASFEC